MHSPIDMTGEWQQAPENTLKSLRHGILHSDGVEFDLRLTSDGELVIHHDSVVSIPEQERKGRPKWVDLWSLDELREVGFTSFEDFIQDSIVKEQWIEHGKMACLEFKRPHLLSPNGRGLVNKSRQYQYMSKAIKLAEEILDANEIPNENSVFYAFFRGMQKVTEKSKIKRNWAELMPSIPSIGNRTFKRMYAYPQYMLMPFSRLAKRHRKSGASMIPCAIEYFSPLYGRALIGRKVGLEKKNHNYLFSCQKGMPTYVWPAKLELEHKILNAGLTGLTDHLDPELTWLPSGNARWNFPATMPLDKSQLELLNSATYDAHKSIIKQLKNEVPKWHECDKSRRIELVNWWRKKWRWDYSVDDILSNTTRSPPWQSIRLIGHRGSGKTSRPVIKNNHLM